MTLSWVVFDRNGLGGRSEGGREGGRREGGGREGGWRESREEKEGGNRVIS